MKQDNIEKLKKLVLQRAYYNAVTQARLRGQDWTITKEQFFELWSEDDRWAQRGTSSSDLTFSRIDMEGDWSIDNVDIITRADMLRREAQYKRSRKCR